MKKSEIISDNVRSEAEIHASRAKSSWYELQESYNIVDLTYPIRIRGSSTSGFPAQSTVERMKS
jgi:hypothetical protein